MADWLKRAIEQVEREYAALPEWKRKLIEGVEATWVRGKAQ